MTSRPELFENWDARLSVLPSDPRVARLAERIGRPMRFLSYYTYDPATDRDSQPPRHIIAEICARSGLHGKVALRPHYFLSQAENRSSSAWAGSIVLQSDGMGGAIPMLTKQWFPERFQAITDFLAARKFRVIQVGSKTDPPLAHATDLRGKTTLRETATILAGARLFVGSVGLLMHLARAVDCPAAIIYGGRELPDLTGYPCNFHLTNSPPCSPCWQRNTCNFDMTCMRAITADHAIATIERALDFPRDNLQTAEVEL